MTFSTTLSSIDALDKELQSWTPATLKVTVATSLTDDTPKVIDLVDCVGKVARSSKGTLSNPHWLPMRFCSSDESFRQNVLSPYFMNACRAAGFPAVILQTRMKQNTVIFGCQKGRYLKSEAKSGSVASQDDDDTDSVAPSEATSVASEPRSASKRKWRAQRPQRYMGVETCKCRFNVCFDPQNKRWFIPRLGPGTLSHNDHVQKDPKEIRSRSKVVGEKEFELAFQMLRQFTGVAPTAGVVSERTGVDLEMSQIQANFTAVFEQRMWHSIGVCMHCVWRGTLDLDGEVGQNVVMNKERAASFTEVHIGYKVAFMEVHNSRGGFLLLRQNGRNFGYVDFIFLITILSVLVGLHRDHEQEAA